MKSYLKTLTTTLCLILGTLLPSQAQTLLGVDVLKSENFKSLHNKRIGLLTNQAGVDSKGTPTWKILLEEPSVNLTTLFAPEHGIEGTFAAGEDFENTSINDIQVYATYGAHAKPKAEWLENLEAVVIDLQGLGIRYYTYTSSMLYMMGACFEEGIEVIILDRPNPLGGLITGGPILSKELTSFLGCVDGMPLIHGLTAAEIANYVKNRGQSLHAHPNYYREEFVCGLDIPASVLKKGQLTLITMKNWNRSMHWEDTGLKWTPTSPRIQNLESVYDYAHLGPVTIHRNTYADALSFEAQGSGSDIRHFGCIRTPHTVHYSEKEIFTETTPFENALSIITEFAQPELWNALDEQSQVLALKHLGDIDWVDFLRQSPEERTSDGFTKKWAQQAEEFKAATQPYHLYN